MNFKTGFVAIIGRPNVGKSTLINSLVGEKITITSDKAQTTRNKIQCILTTKTSQIIFIDTPGIVKKANNKLGKLMQLSSSSAYEGVDIIIFVVTPESFIGQMDSKIIQSLGNNKNVFLVINKIDTISKGDLLKVIDIYSKNFNFKEIVPISAINNQIYNLTQLIENNLKEGPLYFPTDTITDQTERQVASEIIREKLLRILQQEIPHGIAVEILQMKKRNEKNIIDVFAIIYCERDSQKGIVIGKNGGTLKSILTKARHDIEILLDCKIYLQAKVKVKKNWRNDDILLKNLGYINNKS